MNRNKLISLFISNLSNAILHEILKSALSSEEITEKYTKEIKNSWQIAIEYRNKINPKDFPLLDKDSNEIQEKLIRNVQKELSIRISKGYTNINLNLVETLVINSLRELKII